MCDNLDNIYIEQKDAPASYAEYDNFPSSIKFMKIQVTEAGQVDIKINDQGPWRIFFNDPLIIQANITKVEIQRVGTSDISTQVLGVY